MSHEFSQCAPSLRSIALVALLGLFPALAPAQQGRDRRRVAELRGRHLGDEVLPT